MRHLIQGRKLSRTSKHLKATLRNISRNLILLERIQTTPAKAKEARRYVERLITLGRKGDLHARRLALSMLPDKEAIHKLFADIGPRFKDRPGGYTRILRLTKHRLGDNAPQVIFQLVGAQVKPKEEPKPEKPEKALKEMELQTEPEAEKAQA